MHLVFAFLKNKCIFAICHAKNINKFIEYNIIISFLNKKRYKNKEKTKEIVHLIQDMEKKFINVHLELNSTVNYTMFYIKNQI